MIARGLFHSIKALSKNGAYILELESPIDKDDLVRFKDDYGRQSKPYEGKKFTKNILHPVIERIIAKDINSMV